MLPINPLSHDLIFFLLIVLLDAGQWSDARTTEVGLTSGFQEGNPIGAFLIKHLGITGLYALKCAGFPILCVLLYGTLGFHVGIVAELLFAGLGFAAGIRNYIELHKNKIKVF